MNCIEHLQSRSDYSAIAALIIEDFRAALAIDPNHLNEREKLGVLLFFQKNYAGATPYLRLALAQRSDLNKIRSLLGVAECIWFK